MDKLDKINKKSGNNSTEDLLLDLLKVFENEIPQQAFNSSKTVRDRLVENMRRKFSDVRKKTTTDSKVSSISDFEKNTVSKNTHETNRYNVLEAQIKNLLQEEKKETNKKIPNESIHYSNVLADDIDNGLREILNENVASAKDKKEALTYGYKNFEENSFQNDVDSGFNKKTVRKHDLEMASPEVNTSLIDQNTVPITGDLNFLDSEAREANEISKNQIIDDLSRSNFRITSSSAFEERSKLKDKVNFRSFLQPEPYSLTDIETCVSNTTLSAKNEQLNKIIKKNPPLGFFRQHQKKAIILGVLAVSCGSYLTFKVVPSNTDPIVIGSGTGNVKIITTRPTPPPETSVGSAVYERFSGNEEHSDPHQQYLINNATQDHATVEKVLEQAKDTSVMYSNSEDFSKSSVAFNKSYNDNYTENAPARSDISDIEETNKDLPVYASETFQLGNATPSPTDTSVILEKKPLELARTEDTGVEAINTVVLPTERPDYSETKNLNLNSSINKSQADANFYIQIASLPTLESAQKTSSYLSHKYNTLLSTYPVEIHEVNIKGKGTYYRLRIPFVNRDKAISLCETYKQNGGSCFVVSGDENFN